MVTLYAAWEVRCVRGEQQQDSVSAGLQVQLQLVGEYNII